MKRKAEGCKVKGIQARYGRKGSSTDRKGHVRKARGGVRQAGNSIPRLYKARGSPVHSRQVLSVELSECAC